MAKKIIRRRQVKNCVGCDQPFLTLVNYDYCANCGLNNSRYVSQKCPEHSPGYFTKCPECGDGSGWVKFPQQPRRKCKTCYLTKFNSKTMSDSQEENFWDQVNLLAQEKIYQLLTNSVPLQNIKLIKEDYTFEDRQTKLSGLFLTRDTDYRTLLADIENQYADTNLPTPEQLAEEIAVNYFYLVFKALLTDLSDYYGYDPSHFSLENLFKD